MKLNYLKIMRTTTNLTLLAFVFIAVAMTLWIADMALKWDILPAWIQRYAELFITSVTLLTVLLVLSSFLTALVSLVELQAVNQTQPITPHSVRFKPQHKWFLAIGLVVVIIIFVFFHQIDVYRKQQIEVRDIQSFTERLERESSELDTALTDVLRRIPPNLLNLMATAQHITQSDHEKIKILATFLHSLKLSIKGDPNVTLLLPAHEPYRYMLLSLGADYSHDKPELNKTFLLQFVQGAESEYIQQLFTAQSTPLDKEIKGQFIDNSHPSSWGILRQEDKVVAVLGLRLYLDNYYLNKILRKKHDFFHDGPTTLLSNVELGR